MIDISRPHLLYIFDPMCSWCYGFAPVIEAIAEHFGDRLPVKLMVGGLRAGNTVAMTAKDRDYIRGAWTRVGAASGQPFDFAFFDREHFVYDTEPACRAVVTVRSMAPDKALAFKAAVSARSTATTAIRRRPRCWPTSRPSKASTARRSSKSSCRPTSATRPSATS